MSDSPTEPGKEDGERTIAVPPPSSESGIDARGQPTVLESGSSARHPAPRTSSLNRDAVEAAVRKGLITRTQGSTFLDRSGSDSDVLEVLVDQGLIQPEAAEQLREEVAEDFVPGYRVLGELGRGGMGVVYRAVHRSLNRQVALKVITPELRLSREHADRFKREAQTLAALNHPNIVQVYDTGEVGDKLYISLELVDGEDLGDYVDRKQRLDPLEATQVILDAARGLAHAFASEAKVIHRDVKPGNLLRAKVAGISQPVTKVTDLGLASMRGEGANSGRKTKVGTIMGSPSYMSPEQAAGDPVDHRADIYSLGATYYHFLVGEPPFVGPLVKVLTRRLSGEQVSAPSDRVEGIPDAVVRVVDRMLAQEPEHRYANYDALVADLEAIIAGAPPTCPTVPRDASSLSFAAGGPPELQPQPGAAASPARGSSGALPFALLALAGLIASGAYFVHKARQTPTPPGGGAAVVTSSAPPRDPSAEARAAVEQLLGVLESREASTRLSLLPSAQTVRAQIEELPERERPTYRARLQALSAEVIEAGLAEGEALYRDARYQELSTRCAALRGFAEVGGLELGSRLEELAGFAQAGCASGSAERRALATLEKAAAAGAPQTVLKLATSFPERFPFSPALERVEALRVTAEAALPLIELRCPVEGAMLFVDGVDRHLPFQGRFERGSEVVVNLRAPGYYSLRRVLKVSDPLALELRPSPIPSSALHVRGEGISLFGLSSGETSIDKLTASRGWTILGEWTSAVDPDSGVPALLASPTPKVQTSARVRAAETSRLLKRRLSPPGFKGSRLQLELGLPAGAELEVRALEAEQDAVAVRVRGNRLELGVRRQGVDALDVRATYDMLATPYVLYLDWDGEFVVVRARCEGMAAVEPLGSFAPSWTLPAPADTAFTFVVGGSPEQGEPVVLRGPSLELLVE
ncbi:MAG: protein kinase [Planctomycetes bacterium]|nr:protein kinase [Planctomycetota bacterium]